MHKQKGVQEAMALQTLFGELGLKVTITVYTDSSAAKASAEKPGLMHMKHMQLRELFLKQVVQQGLVVIEKMNTLWNPADMLTKPVSGQCRNSGAFSTTAGRASSRST